ncbi:C-type lectin mannose-binding isoform-like isoform X6 [Carassius auratus]|uniref:C-type lectin mannose-binding isoform-like isoform X6 n=1 Tax=Carassius auratus TaxID=7957 RepID=A0A6P6K9L6_CARAU|nr:C-type lectin mannose-binding isoform-like isoform X6 [Carassius auratus]
MHENIYMNPMQHNPGSEARDQISVFSDKKFVGNKRDGVYLVVLLSILLFLSLLATAVLACLCLPEKWVQDKGRFYVFSNDTKEWNSSRQRCQDLGGDLVIINSSEEQEFLAQQIVDFNALVLHWIGLTDHQTEGVWLWVDNSLLNNNISWLNLFIPTPFQDPSQNQHIKLKIEIVWSIISVWWFFSLFSSCPCWRMRCWLTCILAMPWTGK